MDDLKDFKTTFIGKRGIFSAAVNQNPQTVN